MSATLQPIRTPSTRLALAGRCVASDPDAGQWLFLEQAKVAGILTWLVVYRHPTRAMAEVAAGFHDSPVVCWMLYHEHLRWRRRSGKGWMHAPSAITQYERSEAEAIAAAEPGLQLLVVRANGLITCPDIGAGA